MKRATVSDMEMGNAIFGNSRGLYHVEPRDLYQDVFCEFLDENGFDMYGHKDGSKSREFDNGVFVIRPYYWGDDEEIAALPNFEFKPTGLQIKWYKYPMRDAYSNMDISVEDLKAILIACTASMRNAMCAKLMRKAICPAPTRKAARGVDAQGGEYMESTCNSARTASTRKPARGEKVTKQDRQGDN